MLLEIITHPAVKKFQIMHIFCPLVQGGREILCFTFIDFFEHLICVLLLDKIYKERVAKYQNISKHRHPPSFISVLK